MFRHVSALNVGNLQGARKAAQLRSSLKMADIEGRNTSEH